MTHNVAMGACERAGQWRVTLQLAERLRDRRLQADEARPVAS